MIKVYFDGVLIDENLYTAYSETHQMFLKDIAFGVGSVPAKEIKISVDKSAISSTPEKVVITLDDADWAVTVVDTVTENKSTFDYNLKDLMVLFNVSYDARPIITASSSGTVTTLEIFEDICNKVGVETDVTSFLGDDIEVSWYNTDLNARDYISMLAELNAGFAYITKDGKLDFKRYSNISTSTIDIDTCVDFYIGELHTISRVVYDSGLNIYEQGERTGYTVYLNSNNVYILGQSTVDDIYDVLNGLSFYSYETSNCPIDTDIQVGDMITFSDGVDDFLTIAQPDIKFFGSFYGDYRFDCKTSAQQETRDLGTSDSIRNIQVEIDRTNNLVSTTITETGKNTTNISNLTQDIENLTFSQTFEGGVNLIYNSAKIIVDEIDDYWTFSGGYDGYTTESTLTRSRRIQYIGNGWEETSQAIPNGVTCVNFYYKHLLGVGTASVTINGQEFDLADESEWTRFEYNGFEITSNSITITFTGDTLNAFAYYDLMVNSGTEPKLYDQNANEIRKGSTTIGGKSVSVTSTTTNTKISMDAEEGFYIDNTLTDNRAVLGTTSGLETIFVSADTGEIANLRFSKRSSGTALTYIDEV